MKYFSIDELCRSETARTKGIDNNPPEGVRNNLIYLVDNLLDEVRERYGKPIKVNSGYRSPLLNKAINGSPSSDHVHGLAADLDTGTKEGNRKLFNIIIDSGLTFDQLINEKDFSWVHVSLKREINRKMTLKL